MTVKELLQWCIRAYEKYEDSYNLEQKKHLLCKKQSLIQTQLHKPMRGELELAVSIIFDNTFEEICLMNDLCWINKECVNAEEHPIEEHPCDDPTPAQPVPNNVYSTLNDRSTMTEPSTSIHFSNLIYQEPSTPLEDIVLEDSELDELLEALQESTDA